MKAVADRKSTRSISDLEPSEVGRDTMTGCGVFARKALGRSSLTNFVLRGLSGWNGHCE